MKLQTELSWDKYYDFKYFLNVRDWENVGTNKCILLSVLAKLSYVLHLMYFSNIKLHIVFFWWMLPHCSVSILEKWKGSSPLQCYGRLGLCSHQESTLLGGGIIILSNQLFLVVPDQHLYHLYKGKEQQFSWLKSLAGVLDGTTTSRPKYLSLSPVPIKIAE